MKIAWKLLKYLRVAKGLFVTGFIITVIGSGLRQLVDLIIRNIIDDVLTPISRGEAFSSAQILTAVGTYIGITVISVLLGYAGQIFLLRSANRVAEYLRNAAYDKMQHLPVSYFDDKPAGKISSRIINDTETLRGRFYVSLLSQMLLNVLVIVFVYGILIYLNVWLGISLLVLIPLYFFIQHIYRKQVDAAMTDIYEAQSEGTSLVNETMNGSTIIQLFNQEEDMANRYKTVVDRMLNGELKTIKTDAIMSWNLIGAVQRCVMIVVLYVIGTQFLNDTSSITIGVIFAYTSYTDRLFSSIGMLVRQLPDLQRTLTTGRRVLELLEEEEETDSNQQINVTKGEVEFQNVSFSYKEDHYVLKDINIIAKQGETVALVGHTGSGKSSIINLLFRFYDPQKGRILIDGQNIRDYERESIRDCMGIVLQDPFLFTGTIATNISMDNEAMSEAQIMDALEKVGATPMIERLEKGIHEPVIEKGNAFSSGERQLISFARTLASDPKILILDEATSHIDTETEEVIQNAMNVVKAGRTTFIVAHRLSTIQDADQILVLHEGRIVERGTHDELLAQKGKYADMYRMQQKI